jgi:hypothetical protein
LTYWHFTVCKYRTVRYGMSVSPGTVFHGVGRIWPGRLVMLCSGGGCAVLCRRPVQPLQNGVAGRADPPLPPTLQVVQSELLAAARRAEHFPTRAAVVPTLNKNKTHFHEMMRPVLRIHEIFVRIRVRINGSMSMNNGSGVTKQ